jgi:hypothetical protein
MAAGGEKGRGGGGRTLRSDPRLWERVKARILAGDKGGHPGQWSARKAQLAVQAYRKAGGGYVGAKQPDNSLVRWTREAWGTASGGRSRDTGERYLPKSARERLTAEEYARSSRAKRADTARGRQVSPQPADVARKAAAARKAGTAAGSASANRTAPETTAGTETRPRAARSRSGTAAAASIRSAASAARGGGTPAAAPRRTTTRRKEG